jgi:hypothetical protein
MRYLQVAEAVAALVTDRDLDVLRDPGCICPCVVCGRLIRDGEVAAVVLWRFGARLVLARLAHDPGCHRSCVREADPAGLDGPRALLSGTNVYARVAVIEVPGGTPDVPVVVVSPSERILHAGDGGQEEHDDLRTLTGIGPLARIGDLAGWSPAVAPGWRVTVVAGSAAVTMPGDRTLYVRGLLAPERWRVATRRTGWVVLLVGVLGLGDSRNLLGSLAIAARSGMLAGGLVRARAD